MQVRAPAIVCATRPQGENAVIARMLTANHGMVAGYVAGGRGRDLRPVLIPGNLVDAELRARSDSQLPFARLELVQSRGPWLGEPLLAAAIGWTTTLAAAALPERQLPALYEALGSSKRSASRLRRGSGRCRSCPMKCCCCANWVMALMPSARSRRLARLADHIRPPWVAIWSAIRLPIAVSMLWRPASCCASGWHASTAYRGTSEFP